MAFLLHQLLEEAAERYPEKKAVVDRDRHFTYAELDRTSNRLARALIANGIQKGDRVGFYLKKSLESIVSMFAILKAGGVYVPIDPFAPSKRVGYVLRNCGIQCLISSAGALKNLESVLGGQKQLEVIITVGGSLESNGGRLPGIGLLSWSEIVNSHDASRADAGGIDRDLAYILYTSGSTGEPKGVMISHLNALTFVNWGYDTFEIRPEDQVSNHAPLHFDLPVFDIFCGMKAGATVFLAPEEFSVFPRTLIKFIQKNSITVWYSVPSILIHMMVHGNLKDHAFPHLRLILFAGEVFPVKYLWELMGIVPKARYFNLYGPVETNVCTFHHVKQIEPHRSKPVPIGQACRNYEVIVLDERGHPVTEASKTGELCVRGSSVAQGYWGDTARTERGFARCPLSSDYEDRMYRTGDLVTIHEKGVYELIGRKDHMIKSRGYRIELGEIESVLYNHDAIKEVAVLAIPDELVTNRIKAFIVPLGSNSLEKIEIEKYLSDRIPKYMIPEIIEFRDSLPKTSTGKIDRVQLSSF
jgi:amino acid adenylation domain-containing protein